MNTVKKEDKYIINPSYKIRNDIKRIVITNADSNEFDVNIIDETITTSFCWIMHPVHALFFSFFDGEKSYTEVINQISNNFGLPIEETEGMISKYIENKDVVHIPFDGQNFSIPKNFIIKMQIDFKIKNYDRETFIINSNDFDLKNWRMYKPNDLLFVVNNTCVTDCLYCYANKKPIIENYLSFERIKELIKEARELDLRAFDIGGGDIFTYKNWALLIKELLSNNFMPYLSTKYPIGEKEIKILKDLNVRNIQISLDSIINNQLTKILNVNNDYLRKIMITLKTLEKYNIEVNIKSVITSHNSELGDVKKLIEYLLKHKNINSISVAPGEYSLYKTQKEFEYYKTNQLDFKKIEDYVEQIKGSTKDMGVEISTQGYLDSPLKYDFNEKRNRFYERASCSGNVSNFVILPDGKVTICEQLYWDQRFIIGDLNKQSIVEMWNSQKAIDLFNISKDEFGKQSACHSCDEFINCRRYRGVCWKNIIAAYGEKNWDMPDPACHYAPSFDENIFIE